jgi:HAD superfamily hydrolase (TIGR01509 family)
MQDDTPLGAEAIGLDPAVRACLFDLDGVLTRAAEIHAEAWKRTFDAFLTAYDARGSRHISPFDEQTDYELYLDGRTRTDGIRGFLGSRGIEMPMGEPDDKPGTDTMHGIGAAKQSEFLALLETHGPRLDHDAVRYVREARFAGLSCAVVTSSANADALLSAAGVAHLFDVRIDGRLATALGLLGKPAPDEYIAAARGLEVEPEHAAVFDESLPGVEAARAGGFGAVVGVDRFGGEYRARLRAHGATTVVRELGELLVQSGTATGVQPAARRVPGLED